MKKINKKLIARWGKIPWDAKAYYHRIANEYLVKAIKETNFEKWQNYIDKYLNYKEKMNKTI